MNKIFLLVAIVSAMALQSFANIANPDLPGKRKSVDTSLSIRLDRNAKEARLVIPRSQVKQLRAELEQIDGDNGVTAAAGNITGTQTIVSALLMSSAFLFFGIWMTRKGSANSRPVAAAALLLTIGSVANFVYANAGPPPEARTITGKMFSQSIHMYKSGWGKVKLEVSDSVQTPELIVPDPAQATPQE